MLSVSVPTYSKALAAAMCYFWPLNFQAPAPFLLPADFTAVRQYGWRYEESHHTALDIWTASKFTLAWKRRKSVPPLPGYTPATSWVHYTISCNTQSSAPEDGQNNCPKHGELIGITNKPLLLHLVGYLYYLCQWCTVKQIYLL